MAILIEAIVDMIPQSDKGKSPLSLCDVLEWDSTEIDEWQEYIIERSMYWECINGIINVLSNNGYTDGMYHVEAKLDLYICADYWGVSGVDFDWNVISVVETDKERLYE